MKTIYIVDILNTIKPFQLVRCFKYHNKTYLIYTNNYREIEKETSYVKNYVAIKNTDEMWVEPSKEEWNEFQFIIKKIAEESSLGIVTTIQDISVEERNSFIVITSKPFKVIPFYHHLISSNFNNQKLHIPSEQVTNNNIINRSNLQYQYEISSIDIPEIDYVREYYNLKTENNLLQRKLDKINDILKSDFNS